MKDPESNGRSAKNRLKRKPILVVLVVAVIVSVVIIAGYEGDLFGNHSTAKVPEKSDGVTLIPAGTTYDVLMGGFRFAQFSISTHSMITGSFNSTDGITIFIMNPIQFSAFSSTGLPSAYDWTSGHIPAGSISTNLYGGTYHVIFFNDNGFNEPSIVTLITNLTATPMT